MEKIFCRFCGKKKGYFEQFTNNGFCLSCSKRLHDQISQGKAFIEQTISRIAQLPPGSDRRFLEKPVRDALATIASLEQLRPHVPFFKSSLDGQKALLESFLATIPPPMPMPVPAPPPALHIPPVSFRKQITIEKYVDGQVLVYHYEDVRIKGVFYVKPDFTRLELGAPLSFVQEPENPVDDEAVKVMCCGQKLGHVPDNRLKDMVNIWKSNHRILLGYLTRIDPAEEKLYMFMGFYKNPFENIQSMETKKVRLIKTNFRSSLVDRQDSYLHLKVGDVVLIEEQEDDSDEDDSDSVSTFVVMNTDGDELGELPKKVAKELCENGYNELTGLVAEITESDSGTYGAVIDLYYQ